MMKWIGGNSIFVCWRKVQLLNCSDWSLLLSCLEDFSKSTGLNVKWMSLDTKHDGNLFSYLSSLHLISNYIREVSSDISVDSPKDATAQLVGARIVFPVG